MTGNSTGRNFGDYPIDNGDFGRCCSLLKAVPEFRERIVEMAERSKQWAALVACWDELKHLHETDGSACYARMKEALKTAKDPRRVDIGNGVLCTHNCHLTGAFSVRLK